MKASGIGGQALMEGVMMKNGSEYACAIRKPDGEIIVDVQKTSSISDKCKIFKWPIIRGVVTFVESLTIGVKTLTYSASFFDEEEDASKKKEKSKAKDNAFMALLVVLSTIFAIGLFMVLPYFISLLLKKVTDSPTILAIAEGFIRIALFVGYIAAISCMKDIQRVFMYHGAEHKSINCIEQGFELNVENVRKQSREHKRCGTSFMLIVMVISVIFFVFIRVDSTWLMVAIRLLLIPVIAGLSYEFIRLAGRSENKVVVFLSKPGLLLQKCTTREPDDSMIECAIASVEAVFDWKKYQEEAAKEAEEEAIISPAEKKRKERVAETRQRNDAEDGGYDEYDKILEKIGVSVDDAEEAVEAEVKKETEADKNKINNSKTDNKSKKNKK